MQTITWYLILFTLFKINCYSKNLSVYWLVKHQHSDYIDLLFPSTKMLPAEDLTTKMLPAEDPPTTGQTLSVPVFDSAYHKMRRVSCQISRQVSNHSNYEEHAEEEKYSLFYCSMFFFLLCSFICGIILAAVGGTSLNSCPDSWIPVWLLVEGVTICTMFFILFCGDSSSFFRFRMLGSFCVFILLSVWSFLGVIWSFNDIYCSDQLSTFTVIISIFCVILNIIGLLCWVYWWCNSLPCSKKRTRQHKLKDHCQTDHILVVLEE